MTYDGISTLRIYVNGSLATANTNYRLPAAITSADVKIADSGSCGAGFPGIIDEFRV